MGDIGVPELLILLAIVIVLFGPARIGVIGKSIGEAIRGFRLSVREDQPAPASQDQTSGRHNPPENPPLLKESAHRQE